MSRTSTYTTVRTPAARVAAIYCLAALAWILVSDRLMIALVGSDIASLESVSIAKGFLFVAVTAALLHIALSRVFASLEATHRATMNSRDLLAAICECLPDGVYAKDLDGRYIVCNHAAAKIIGVPLKAVLGTSDADLFPLETAERLRAEDEVIRASRKPICVEESYRLPDGLLITQTTRSPIVTQEGRLLGTFGIARDITELRNAVTALADHKSRLEQLVDERTAALSAAEQQFKMIFESAAEGLIFVDDTGLIQLVNPAALAVLGHAPDELTGRNIHEAIHHTLNDSAPTDPDNCPLLRAVRSGTKFELVNHCFWHRSGRPVPVAAAANPIVLDGDVLGAVISFFDITERQRAEEERERARSEAEELARIKSEFLANMSHEIRTPLNGVLGLAHIGYRESAGRDSTRRLFSRILDTGKLLLAIINDILDFSKMEAGKLRIERVPVSPVAIVEQAVHTVRELARDKGLALQSVQSDDLPVAFIGDPVRISQILLNLLSNAIKFTQEGRIRLRVCRTGEDLVFEVSDTGIGIPGELVDKLFSPFEQADTSTSRRYGGTGLGLTISRRLAGMMNGSLSLESCVGVGTVAQLRLPCEEVGQLPEPQIATMAGTRKRLAGLRILVAEDNPLNAFVLEELLRQEGSVVTMVESGAAAVEACRSNLRSFDAILMDVQMPEMDGIEATRRILEFAPSVPILGQTAHVMHDEHDRCLAAGMTAVLTKPLDPEVLVSHVLQQVHRPEPERPFEGKIEDKPAAGLQVIDWSGLSTRYAGRDDILPRLVGLALRNTEGKAEQIRDLARANFATGVEASAYECKLIAANLAAPKLELIATQVITRAGAANPSTASALAYSLADALDEFREHLLDRSAR